MRVPLTPHGVRELLLFGGGFALLGAAAWFYSPLLSVPLWLLALFVLSFFRDPERRPPEDADTAVSPADGTVTDIGIVDEPFVIGGPALRISIFLSVFNVHVNRAPLDGKVTLVRYQKGKFHDARTARCREDNESNLIGFSGPDGPFAVKQIAGAVARRIICPVKVGDEVARGQRMGMIKFGSRTDLYVPSDVAVKVEVEEGQAVKGARTVLLRYER